MLIVMILKTVEYDDILNEIIQFFIKEGMKHLLMIC